MRRLFFCPQPENASFTLRQPFTAASQVSRVLVGEGDVVRRGQPLIVLEAMKMEIKIAAPRDGRVAKVLVRQGQVVDRGRELIEMTRES